MNMSLSPQNRQSHHRSLSRDSSRSRECSPATSRSVVLDSRDPCIDFDKDLDDETALALSEYNMKLMRDFQKPMLKESNMEYCSRFKENWFNTGVSGTV